jgi:hypothetical protein
LFHDDTAAASPNSNNNNNSSTLPLKSFIGFPAFQMPLPPPPDIIPLQEGRRVVCIGDVHGDLEALRSFLIIAQVMNEEDDNWCGGNDICIQLGDIFDRGVQELACCALVAKLARQAATQGGVFTVTWGNHEALNAVGLFQYTMSDGDDEFERFIGTPLDLFVNHDKENDVVVNKSKDWRLQYAGNQPSRWAAMEPGGLLSESLLQHFKVAIVVGRTLCVHAGLTKQHVMDYGGISGMNRQAREWIVTQHAHECQNNDGSFTNGVDQIIQEAQERARLASSNMPACLGGGKSVGGSSHSPVWMRDYSQPNDAPPRNSQAAQRMINEVLQVLKCERMVIGHTPQFQINAALQNKAWRIDVGASQGVMGGSPEVLEIIHGEDEDTVSILTRDGKRVPACDRQVVDSSILF